MTAVAHHDLDRLDLFEADIRRQSTVLADGAMALRDGSAEIARALAGRPPRAYLVGSGDSLDGAIAARPVWESVCGIPTEAIASMTFSTSEVERAPEGSLVVVLSQSGKVSRAVEAVRAARRRGLPTVAITASGSSPLAGEPTSATWVFGFEKLGAIPGTTSYALGALAFMELACAFAPGPAATAVRSSIDGVPDLIAEAVANVDPVAERHATAMERSLPVLAIGYGPVLSSARFTVRKLLELTQLVTLWQETEEYAHDEYSLVDERFRVMQFAPPDRGHTRNIEIARYLRRLGSHIAVVTEGAGVPALEGFADLVYPMPDCDAFVRPLVYAVPGQLLSVKTARRVGGSLYGMAERVHREDGDPQIYESEISA